MKYIIRTMAMMVAIFVVPTIFAKSITFNLVTSNGCQLDQAISSSPYKEGVTYKPAPPVHLNANSSSSFRVDMGVSKIPYNTNSELLSGFGLYYKVDCPLAKRSGILVIKGSYYNWYSMLEMIDDSGLFSSQSITETTGEYANYMKNIYIK